MITTTDGSFISSRIEKDLGPEFSAQLRNSLLFCQTNLGSENSSFRPQSRLACFEAIYLEGLFAL